MLSTFVVPQPVFVMGKEVNLKDSLVPFGGSVLSVDNPDKTILGGKGLGYVLELQCEEYAANNSQLTLLLFGLPRFASLQEMSRIGVDVPPGFTLTTPLCQVFQQSNDLPAEMWEMVKEAVKTVEADTGKKYGSDENPLLFSCRSGAAISMPGMMDTVLNIVREDS
jgi:hypothetical protein